MQLLLLALLFNGATLIQLPGLIAGTVVDPSGAAVPNATVRLEISGRTVDEISDGQRRAIPVDVRSLRTLARGCYRSRIHRGRCTGVSRLPERFR